MYKRTFLILILLFYVLVRVMWKPTSQILEARQKFEAHKAEVEMQEKNFHSPAPVSQMQDGVVTFRINPPQNFNDKTKEDIYDIRRMNVGNSPLYPSDYQPSEVVFGQIVSQKPWFGKYSRPCRSDASNTARGESLLSPIINNPNALIAPFALSISNKRSLDTDYCKAHDAMIFTPSKIEYTPSKKLLEITYPIDDVIIGKNHYKIKEWLLLSALNAHDAGYHYITAIDITGGYFYNSSWDSYSQTYKPYDNITKIVFNFQDYIHLGTSCGLPGGCNNCSPRQMPMEFALEERPAKIRLKLWRKEPASRNAAPDLYCNLIFE